MKQQATDDAGKDIQDLSRMAIARILYERSQFDKAIEAYASVPRQSKYFADALQEQAWTFIKAKEWQKAYRALDLLLLANPETTDAPHLRLLMGNLNLRMNNFFLASDAFGKVRDEFEPVHRQLQQVIVKAQADPATSTRSSARASTSSTSRRSCRRRPRAGCAPSRTSRA